MLTRPVSTLSVRQLWCDANLVTSFGSSFFGCPGVGCPTARLPPSRKCPPDQCTKYPKRLADEASRRRVPSNREECSFRCTRRKLRDVLSTREVLLADNSMRRVPRGVESPVMQRLLPSCYCTNIVQSGPCAMRCHASCGSKTPGCDWLGNFGGSSPCLQAGKLVQSNQELAMPARIE